MQPYFKVSQIRLSIQTTIPSDLICANFTMHCNQCEAEGKYHMLAFMSHQQAYFALVRDQLFDLYKTAQKSCVFY